MTWVDLTAPGDGCSFALCDPVAVSGQGDGTQNGPLVLSAAFTQTLPDARWRALRWRFFRLHFQYLCAFDQPGFYDYFQITAGPHRLRDRFRGRAPSPSRIVTQTTRYGGAQLHLLNPPRVRTKPACGITCVPFAVTSCRRNPSGCIGRGWRNFARPFFGPT